MTSKTVLIAAAMLAIAPSVASARDGLPYFGLEGGAVKPEKVKLDYQLRALSVNDGIVIKHKTGFDIDAIAG